MPDRHDRSKDHDRSDHDWSEYRDIIRSLGTPEQIRRKLTAIDGLIEDRKFRTRLMGSLKSAGLWAAAVAGGWLALQRMTETIINALTRLP